MRCAPTRSIDARLISGGCVWAFGRAPGISRAPPRSRVKPLDAMRKKLNYAARAPTRRRSDVGSRHRPEAGQATASLRRAAFLLPAAAERAIHLHERQEFRLARLRQ